MNDLKEHFRYHVFDEGQAERSRRINNKALELAELIEELVNEGPERTLAMRALIQAKQHANSAIAIENAGAL